MSTRAEPDSQHRAPTRTLAGSQRGSKLMLLTRSLEGGGAERQLVALATGLHRRGRPVVVLAFYERGPLLEELRAAGVPLRFVGKRGRWDLIGFWMRLLTCVKEERPSILHGYLDVPNILAVLLRLRFPHLRVVWGVRSANMDLSHFDWMRRVTFRAESALAPFSSLVIANSQAGREHRIRLGWPADRITTIPNGIDTNRFKHDAEAGRALRREWGVSDAEFLIGIVGRIDPAKDHATFLKAAARITAERPDMRFVCVGETRGSQGERMAALAHEVGLDRQLIWAGRREDMCAVYSALDLLCSSSVTEGFPNVVGEAMACGVPCVATDAGDSAWLLDERDRVVPRNDAGALARALLQAADRPKEALRAEGQRLRSRIEERFSVKRLLDESERALWPD